MPVDSGMRSIEKAMRERFASLEFITTIRNLETAKPRLGPILFPTRLVTTLNYKYWIEEQERYAMASFQSFDSESETGYHPGREAEWISLAKIGQKYQIKESDIIEFQDGSKTVREEMMNRLEREIFRMAMACRERQEALLIEAMSTGKIAIKENNVIQNVDFHIPAAQRQKLDGVAVWSDLDNSNPILDIQAWMRLMSEEGRDRPTRMIMTERTKSAILMNKNVRTQMFGTEGATRMITEADLDSFLRGLTLPKIVTYDRMSYVLTDKGTLSQFRPFRDGLVVFLPQQALGEMLEGPTVEELMNGISGITVSNRAGLMYSLWGQIEPPSLWHKTVLTCFPTFTQSNNIFIADVMRPTVG